jgi:hypothetical protein
MTCINTMPTSLIFVCHVNFFRFHNVIPLSHSTVYSKFTIVQSQPPPNCHYNKGCSGDALNHFSLDDRTLLRSPPVPPLVLLDQVLRMSMSCWHEPQRDSPPNSLRHAPLIHWPQARLAAMLYPPHFRNIFREHAKVLFPFISLHPFTPPLSP